MKYLIEGMFFEKKLLVERSLACIAIDHWRGSECAFALSCLDV